MHQAVEDVRRLAHHRRDHLRIEQAIAPGDLRVEHEPRLDAVFGVDRAASASAPAGPEILAVRRGGRAIVPDRRHRMLVVCVDDGGPRGDVVVVADVPLRHIHQVVVADPV